MHLLAIDCHQLAANDDDDERKKTLFNADTYVYYALVSKVQHSLLKF
jgi:hypothetical protein